jgi:hypothetical protein
MNDQEIFKLTEITSRSGIEKVCFEFEDAYCDIVYCIIHRTYRGSIPVMSHSVSSDDALENALELLEEVKVWDKMIKKPSADLLSSHPGYYRVMIDPETQVEFKNIGIDFAITGIRRKDSDGFYYSKEPHPVKEEYTFVKDLADGTKLYTWNDIGPLCGSAGELIVKDGLVIKSKMTIIS